ncbi:hypothetical protein [Streptomyces rubellomurinus]|uniref:Lipoprotein n=2 Tax=Streptomyces TaxID=1883 RepID=A0A0F2TGP1_STRR3|nr:hypothetical protein [Streptomyces rubellomurinus]KJS60882.1 hypothetical protein VM95_18505 [Streptomyces rubellomurinus]
MRNPTTRPPLTGTRLKQLLATALLATTLGACMSSTSPTTGPGTGKDDPLPVKSRQETLDWAKQLTEHLAQSAGIRINAEPADPVFTSCVGRNGESAPDDRYQLIYGVHSTVPDAQHDDVVRKVRDRLTAEGLTITEYQESHGAEPDATVSARHPSSRYVVDVASTAGHDRMVLSVTTPCLMPPSAPPAPTPTSTP